MENRDLGALWVRQTPKGDKYLTGNISIEGKAYRIVVFKNGYKKAENQPDWRIYESKPKPEPKEDLPDEYPDAEVVGDDDVPF